tara:strand:+ start:1018 stop:1581 length:564 start_codon:yes stop_codon:yes gene_type:complete
MTDDLVGHMTNLIAAGLDRIEQLTAELDGLTQTSAILCDDCGWAMNFPNFGCVYCGFHRLEKERDALTAERERLALAICGGEDAPGYANAQTVETLEHVAKQNCQSHGATINSLLAAEAERDRLREALLDHNDLLRSAIAIAEREGVRGEIASTNWDAYYNRAAVVLKRHHQITTDARAALKGESHE